MRKILSHPERSIFLYTKTARPPTFARDGLAKFSHTKRNVQISLSRLFSAKTLQSNKFVRYFNEKKDTKKKDQSISYQLSEIENKNIFLVAIFSYNSFFLKKKICRKTSFSAAILFENILQKSGLLRICRFITKSYPTFLFVQLSRFGERNFESSATLYPGNI